MCVNARITGNSTHTSEPSLQQSIKTAQRTWEEEEVLSRHTVVLFQRRNVMTGEICRAEPGARGPVFNEGKMRPGS